MKVVSAVAVLVIGVMQAWLIIFGGLTGGLVGVALLPVLLWLILWNVVEAAEMWPDESR